MKITEIVRTQNTVTLHFMTEGQASIWLESFKRTIGFAKSQITNNGDAVKLYHIEKGCCDGTDPSGCHKRKELEAADARIREHAENRRYLDNEYFGTEPSEGDQAFCGHRSNHALLKMGERCGYCKWLA